jgi:hypothetical protein
MEKLGDDDYQTWQYYTCGEFNRLGLIHASLADTRLVTTPTLLSVFGRQDRLASTDALTLLDALSEARSWDTNSYVQRARSLLSDSDYCESLPPVSAIPVLRVAVTASFDTLRENNRSNHYE